MIPKQTDQRGSFQKLITIMYSCFLSMMSNTERFNVFAKKHKNYVKSESKQKYIIYLMKQLLHTFIEKPGNQRLPV